MPVQRSTTGGGAIPSAAENSSRISASTSACENGSGVAAPDVGKWDWNNVNPILNRLLALGLLKPDFSCVESLRHALAIEMIAAPEGLTPAIVAMPDKEERIVARRLSEHEANMHRCLDGIKELAERAYAGG